jgi:outer membrane protein OmpA-like peptidoglycan-associated protein
LTRYALRNINYGKDNFITIGEMGNIFNSPDGISWARRRTQQTDHLYGTAYRNGTFTTVGSNGRILTSSDDGVTWVERYSGTAEHLSAITYGNEKFVAVGAYGTIVTSPDSWNWTTVSSGTQRGLAAITYASKQFIAVAADGTALTSPDGTNWSFSRYGPIAAPTPEKVVIIKYKPTVEKKVVFMASEPKIEKKIRVAAAEPKIIFLAFEDVHFDFAKSTLKPGAQKILKRNVRMLKDNPDVKVRIAGYTSAAGTDAYKQALSERRATAVREYLVNEGVITQDRLYTIGYGETHPAIYEAAPKEIYSKAAKKNMRILFEIIVE